LRLARSTLGIGEERVAAIDHDVARLEQVGQLTEHGVDRGAGLDHEHDAPGPLEGGDELLDRGRPDDARVLSPPGEELLGDCRRAVEHNWSESVARDIQRKVRADDRHPDDSAVMLLRAHASLLSTMDMRSIVCGALRNWAWPAP